MWTTHHHHHQFMRVDVDNGAPRSIAVYFSLQLLRLAGPVEDGGLSTCLLNLLLVWIFIACNCVVSPWHRRGDCLAEVHRQCTWHRGQPFMCKSAPASEGPIHLPDNILDNNRSRESQNWSWNAMLHTPSDHLFSWPSLKHHLPESRNKFGTNWMSNHRRPELLELEIYARTGCTIPLLSAKCACYRPRKLTSSGKRFAMLGARNEQWR